MTGDLSNLGADFMSMQCRAANHRKPVDHFETVWLTHTNNAFLLLPNRFGLVIKVGAGIAQWLERRTRD